MYIYLSVASSGNAVSASSNCFGFAMQNFPPQATSARCRVFCRWKQDADLPAKLCCPVTISLFFYNEGTNSLGSRPRKPRVSFVTVSLGTKDLLKPWLNQPVSHILRAWKSIFQYLLELTYVFIRVPRACIRMPT